MPIDAFGYILNNPEQLGKQLSSGGNLPDFAKAELLQASVHAGQYEFASHPVTKGAVNAVTFIAPGGVSGVMALKSLGAKLFTKAAVKGGTQGFKSLGAAGRGFSKTLQTGGHTLNKYTLKSLGLSKEQGKIAIEALKKSERLPNNFHAKIMGNGDYVNAHTGEWIGNLFDYIP
jgi:hypothetical protein